MAQVQDEGLLLGGQIVIGAMHARCVTVYVLTGSYSLDMPLSRALLYATISSRIFLYHFPGMCEALRLCGSTASADHM